MSTEQLSPEEAAKVWLEERHAHPGTGTYVAVGIILAIITGVEVSVYSVESIKPMLAPILVVLSAVKFFLVVSFFMHLRFDNRLFAAMFCFGLLVAFSIISAFLLLFSVHPALPIQH